MDQSNKDTLIVDYLAGGKVEPPVVRTVAAASYHPPALRFLREYRDFKAEPAPKKV